MTTSFAPLPPLSRLIDRDPSRRFPFSDADEVEEVAWMTAATLPTFPTLFPVRKTSSSLASSRMPETEAELAGMTAALATLPSSSLSEEEESSTRVWRFSSRSLRSSSGSASNWFKAEYW